MKYVPIQRVCLVREGTVKQTKETGRGGSTLPGDDGIDTKGADMRQKGDEHQAKCKSRNESHLASFETSENKNSQTTSNENGNSKTTSKATSR